MNRLPPLLTRLPTGWNAAASLPKPFPSCASFVDVGDYLGAPAGVVLRAVARLEVGDVGAHDRINLLGVGEDRLVLRNRREQLRKILASWDGT